VHADCVTDRIVTRCRARREKGGELRVAPRAARPGDTLVLDFNVFHRDSGKAIPGLAKDRHEVDTMVPEMFLPGITPQLMGAAVGDTRNADFTFPDVWEPPELGGVHASVRACFRLLCSDVRRPCLDGADNATQQRRAPSLFIGLKLSFACKHLPD
jgi:hypothetical protein